jgi:surface protein
MGISTVGAFPTSPISPDYSVIVPHSMKIFNCWNVSQVTDMSQMFQFATAFNQNISAWDVSRVTTTAAMFRFASAFQSKHWCFGMFPRSST